MGPTGAPVVEFLSVDQKTPGRNSAGGSQVERRDERIPIKPYGRWCREWEEPEGLHRSGQPAAAAVRSSAQRPEHSSREERPGLWARSSMAVWPAPWEWTSAGSEVVP